MKTFTRGLTLVELLVVVAIISILATIVVASFADIRANARDTKRMSDIDQIGLALRLYGQEKGGLPDCFNGRVLESGRGAMYANEGCAEAAAIESYLVDYFGEMPVDPLGPGSDDYFYYYDSAHGCFSSGSVAMVFAVNMETKPSNGATSCEVVSGNDGGYIRTNTIDPSQPYVYLLERI